MNTLDDAVDLVVAYLKAMENRDLATAQGFVAQTGLELVFPGDRRFSGLDEIRSNSAGRYGFVGKTITETDAWQNGETTRVMVQGTLHGEWRDGAPFEGIRFVDLFDLTAGKIRRQQVWNDTAERLIALGKEWQT